MGFNWEKFLDVAEHLRKYSDKEEFQRSAVGRYYYACYLEARDIYNELIGVPKGTKIEHWRLIKELRKSRNNSLKEIGNQLKKLFEYRKNADYDENFIHQNLEKSKMRSKEIYKLFDEIE